MLTLICSATEGAVGRGEDRPLLIQTLPRRLVFTRDDARSHAHSTHPIRQGSRMDSATTLDHAGLYMHQDNKYHASMRRAHRLGRMETARRQ